MSNTLTTLVWPLQMPPTAKAVLVALAWHADDSGLCWPSLTTLSERTCFGRTAVIEAVKWLELQGAIRADRSDRYRTTYIVTPASFISTELVRVADQSASNTSPPDGALVRLADDEVRQPDDEVRQADTKDQERSGKVEQEQKRARAPTRPESVTAQTWNDWLALRRAKRAPVTETVLASATDEAAKAGLSLEAFLRVWCARGSQGLQADWLKPNERGPPQHQQPGKNLSAILRLQERKRERQLAADGNRNGDLQAALPGPGRAAGGGTD